jgi:CBS domain-containing protein
VHGLDDTATLPSSSYSELATADPDVTVDECLQIMVRAGENKLLIVDGTKELKGILSIRDILNAAVR